MDLFALYLIVCPFVPFLLSIVLSAHLRITAYDTPLSVIISLL